jgi:2,5-diamino-6-(ribosylamino)-4(3H)-pyrimidinone 5'-phosphate reductase
MYINISELLVVQRYIFKRKRGMRMKVVMHNSISLDGCYTGFEVDMGLHYQIAGWFHPDIHIIGSATAKSGAMMGGSIRDEEPADFIRKEKEGPLWVIIDSKGITKGLLHVFRQSEYCGDIMVLVSKKTPKSFLDYLNRRHYNHLSIGDKKVDLKKAFAELEKRFSAKTALVDSGAGLASALLEAKLVDEISLIVCPESVGGERLFDELPPLELIKAKRYGGFCWLLYRAIK